MSRAAALTNEARSLPRSASQTIASRLCTRPMRRASPPGSSSEWVESGATGRVTAARPLSLSPGRGRGEALPEVGWLVDVHQQRLVALDDPRVELGEGAVERQVILGDP